MDTMKLRGKMSEKGITGERLADLLGVSSNTVYTWLKTGNIKSTYLRDIKAVLDLSPEETISIFFSEK